VNKPSYLIALLALYALTGCADHQPSSSTLSKEQERAFKPVSDEAPPSKPHVPVKIAVESRRELPVVRNVDQFKMPDAEVPQQQKPRKPQRQIFEPPAPQPDWTRYDPPPVKLVQPISAPKQQDEAQQEMPGQGTVRASWADPRDHTAPGGYVIVPGLPVERIAHDQSTADIVTDCRNYNYDLVHEFRAENGAITTVTIPAHRKIEYQLPRGIYTCTMYWRDDEGPETITVSFRNHHFYGDHIKYVYGPRASSMGDPGGRDDRSYLADF
jgi:hypothetical protein